MKNKKPNLKFNRKNRLVLLSPSNPSYYNSQNCSEFFQDLNTKTGKSQKINTKIPLYNTRNSNLNENLNNSYYSTNKTKSTYRIYNVEGKKYIFKNNLNFLLRYFILYFFL